MGNVFYFDWEIHLMEWVQEHLGRMGETISVIFTMFGEELLLIAILGMIYWSLDKEKGKEIGLMVILSTLANTMVKNVFNRRRPYMDNPSVKCLRPIDPNGDLYDPAVQEFSFPSGHAMNSVTEFGGLAILYKHKIWKILAIAMPILIGVSRVALGVHYPTDILAGWILGLIIVTCVHFLWKKVNIHVLFSVMILLGLTGFFFCTSNDYFTAMGMLMGFYAAILFEGKYVRFRNTKNIFRGVLRVIVGGGLYLALNEVLKVPFRQEFLESAAFLAHLVRTLRYCLVMFLLLGVYPLSFNMVDKWAAGRKK